jgi:hypothetical protein
MLKSNPLVLANAVDDDTAVVEVFVELLVFEVVEEVTFVVLDLVVVVDVALVVEVGVVVTRVVVVGGGGATVEVPG